ncbi:hypothetical protein [Lacipirellula sp.]|uniref:hypothetical protein n=1 Tax=Lacipirellula sp. TaxID=2691419 RepID=UPI003D0EF668
MQFANGRYLTTADMPDRPRVLTVAQIAALCGVSASTVRRRIAAGMLKGRRDEQVRDFIKQAILGVCQ